jgi:hypothetical protein
MSKYDVEVEERLQKLEKESRTYCLQIFHWVKSIRWKNFLQLARLDLLLMSVEGKLDLLISVLKRTAKLNIEKLSGGRL